MYSQTLKTLTGKLKITIPTTLHELPLGTFIAMSENTEYHFYYELAILSGLPVEEIKQVIDHKGLEIFGQHLLSLAHQIRYMYDAEAVPDYVMFGSKKVKVIKNLSIQPVGAFMAARDIMAEEINKHLAQHGEDDDWKKSIRPSARACAMILAHYFYWPVTGNLYEEQAAEEFVSEVEKLSLQDALPIARYFFLNYPN